MKYKFGVFPDFLNGIISFEDFLVPPNCGSIVSQVFFITNCGQVLLCRRFWVWISWSAKCPLRKIAYYINMESGSKF